VKRLFFVACIVSCFSGISIAAVNMNVQTYADYTLQYNTNIGYSVNKFALGWLGVGLYADIAKGFKGNFLLDLSGNSPLVISSGSLAGLWYANVAWTVFPGSVLTAGLQDSLFGLTVPTDAFNRNIDYGVTWAQSFADVFGYSLQVIQGDVSAIWFDANTVFNGVVISEQTRSFPTVQLLLNLTPVKGMTIGAAGRFSRSCSYWLYSMIMYTNFEIGVEGYLAVGSDLVPGLNLTLDYVTLMNTIHITNLTTNASGYYFAADLSYAIGPVAPGLRYWVKDADLTPGMTNDIDQFIAVYAKISLTADGLVKLIPYFEYHLMVNGISTPEDLFVARLRFDYQFDIPFVKDPDEAKETK
jgi:hypothetical protein